MNTQWENLQIIDSRDIIDALDDLTDEYENLQSALADAEMEDDLDKVDIAKSALADWLLEYEDELFLLTEINADGKEACSDWVYGATMIREDYFPLYIKEQLEDCGEIPSNLPDYIVVNWEKTADNCLADYVEIEIRDTIYYILSL